MSVFFFFPFRSLVSTRDEGSKLANRLSLISSTATIDRPFVGRSISYHPAPAVSPDSLVPPSTIATSTPLAAPVPPSASSLQVFIPLTLPLNVPHRAASDPPPPPVPPKSPVRAVRAPQPAVVSPLASPASQPSPLSTPGREMSTTLPNGYIAIPQAAYSQLMSPANSHQTVYLAPREQQQQHVPSPLSTPGREEPPSSSVQVPTVPSTSAEAAQLHATMVAAAVAAATEQIERSQSAASNATCTTSSSVTIMPHSLQAAGPPRPPISSGARKPVPALFALSNAATERPPAQSVAHAAMAFASLTSSTPTRQLTLPEMVITGSQDPSGFAASIVPGYSSSSSAPPPSKAHLATDDPNGGPHREFLPAGPASIPLSRYGTRGASNVPPPVVVFTPPPPLRSVDSARLGVEGSYRETTTPPPLSNPTSVVEQMHRADDGTLDSTETSQSDVDKVSMMNRSNSSLALVAPLTKFPDPAFPRRPLVLSEHVARFRKSSSSISAAASPSSLWHEKADGVIEAPNGDATVKRRRKAFGTAVRNGKGAAIKWVGRDGLLGEDESWTTQKWGLMFTVASVSLSLSLSALVFLSLRSQLDGVRHSERGASCLVTVSPE